MQLMALDLRAQRDVDAICALETFDTLGSKPALVYTADPSILSSEDVLEKKQHGIADDPEHEKRGRRPERPLWPFCRNASTGRGRPEGTRVVPGV